MTDVYAALMIVSFMLTISGFPENESHKMMKSEDGGKGPLTICILHHLPNIIDFLPFYLKS